MMDLPLWTETLSEMTFCLKLYGDFSVPQGRNGARAELLLPLRDAPEPARGLGEGPGPAGQVPGQGPGTALPAQGPGTALPAAGHFGGAGPGTGGGIPANVPPMPPLPADFTPYGEAGTRAWTLYQDLRT